MIDKGKNGQMIDVELPADLVRDVEAMCKETGLDIVGFFRMAKEMSEEENDSGKSKKINP